MGGSPGASRTIKWVDIAASNLHCMFLSFEFREVSPGEDDHGIPGTRPGIDEYGVPGTRCPRNSTRVRSITCDTDGSLPICPKLPRK